MKVTLLVISILAFAVTAWPQDRTLNRDSLARAHISALKQGTLLVRLPGQRTKIEALRTTLEDDSLGEKERARLQQMLDDAMAERERVYADYKAAFDQYYSFSRYRFFYDYDTPAILEGEAAFIGQDTLDASVFDGVWYILSVGHTPESRIDGLVILDKSLEPLPKPFPSAIITSGLTGFIFDIFTSDPLGEHIRRLDRKLTRFYDRHFSGGR